MCIRYALRKVVRETPRNFLVDVDEASGFVFIFENGRLRSAILLWDRRVRCVLLRKEANRAFAGASILPKEQT
jgi:hypothetical protein